MKENIMCSTISELIGWPLYGTSVPKTLLDKILMFVKMRI